MVLPNPVPPLAPPMDGPPLPVQMPAFATGPTPDDVLNFMNEAVAALEEEVEAELREETTPRYPPWLKMTGTGKDAHPKDFPRPDPAATKDYVERLHVEFSDLRHRFSEDIALLKGTRAGHFADASEDEKQSLYHDSTLQAEHEAIVAHVGAINPVYRPEVRQRADADEAADKADFLYACDDEAERRHANLGNGPWRPDVVRSDLIYGRIAAFISYKLECDEGDVPFREHLIDPSTCLPVHDDHGLAKMGRVYYTTLAAACAAFDYDGKINEKLAEVKKQKRLNDARAVKVMEYWDRWWKLIWIEDVLVVGPVAHKLGDPPFIYQMGALGLPGFVRDVNDLSSAADLERGSSIVNMRDAAMPNKGLSHVHYFRYPVWLREALTARIITHFRRQIDPAYLIYQTHAAEVSGVPEISNIPGDRSTAKEGQERVEIVPNLPQAESYAPLMQLNNDALGRLGMPPEAYGINASGTNSGFAIEGLTESGRDKLVPHLLTLQMFYQQLAERRLKLYRDWGWLIKQGYEKRGQLYLPRVNPLPLQETMFQVTPGMIRRTGTRCRVRMTQVKMQSLTQVTNALAIMKNMQLGNPIYYYELLGHPNPERAVQEDRFHAMMQDPAYLRAELIKYLEKQGDVQSAAYLRAQGSQPQAPPMLATDELSNGNPVQFQGASLPGVGQPPGPMNQS